jgi:chromosome segregation ATPase
MTYSLDERATGSSDVAHKGKQKPRQPKLNQTALRAALATAHHEAAEARAALATAQQEAAEARAALATAQQEATEAQRRLDELRATLIDLRTRRVACAGAEAVGETKGQTARVVAMGYRRLMGTPAFAQMTHW